MFLQFQDVFPPSILYTHIHVYIDYIYMYMCVCINKISLSVMLPFKMNPLRFFTASTS